MGAYFQAGVPGTGKTLKAIADWIVPALQEGRPVYTNIDGIDHDKLAIVTDIPLFKVHSLLHFIDPTDIEACQYFYKDPNATINDANPYGYREMNALLVMDEVQNYFGSTEYATQASKDFIFYITKQRHYRHDVLLVTQSPDSVIVGVRRVCALTYWMKSGGYLGLGAKNCIVHIYEGAELKGKPLNKKVWRHPEKYYRVYSSYQGEGREEKKESANLLTSDYRLWIFLLVLIGIIVFALFNNPVEAINKAMIKKPAGHAPSRPAGSSGAPTTKVGDPRGFAGRVCIITSIKKGAFYETVYSDGTSKITGVPSLNDMCR